MAAAAGCVAREMSLEKHLNLLEEIFRGAVGANASRTPRVIGAGAGAGA
jgi:hypothetical protein